MVIDIYYHLLIVSPIDRAEYLPQQYGGHWYDLWQTSVVDRIRNHMMGAVKEALKEAGYN